MSETTNYGLNDTLDWNGTLESDGSEYTVLPEGDYVYEVVNMERGSFPGSEKMGKCNKATLTLRVTDDTGNTVQVFDDLILHKRMEWKLSQFFLSVGLKKRGEPLVMDWNKVVGAKGKVHITVNKYTAKDGSTRENNKVARYIDYDKSGLTPQDKFMKVPDELSDELPFV